MKPLSPATIDFRLTITPELDAVLTAKARASNSDKAAVARDLLNAWATEQLLFLECMQDGESDTEEQALRVRLRRKQLNRRTRNSVFARDGFKCRECGAEPGFDKLQIDHIVPITAGGTDELKNLRVLCRDCNRSKSNKIVALDDPEDIVEPRSTKK